MTSYDRNTAILTKGRPLVYTDRSIMSKRCTALSTLNWKRRRWAQRPIWMEDLANQRRTGKTTQGHKIVTWSHSLLSDIQRVENNDANLKLHERNLELLRSIACSKNVMLILNMQIFSGFSWKGMPQPGWKWPITRPWPIMNQVWCSGSKFVVISKLVRFYPECRAGLVDEEYPFWAHNSWLQIGRDFDAKFGIYIKIWAKWDTFGCVSLFLEQVHVP